MGPVDAADFALTFVGLGLAIWSMKVAGGAKKAVAEVIAKSGDQKTRDEVRGLLTLVQEAREAAMAHRKTAAPLASAGRVKDNDLQALHRVQDALATTQVAGDPSVTARFRRAAKELDKALNEISTNGARDGWADGLAALQGVTPDVDQLQKKLGAQALR